MTRQTTKHESYMLLRDGRVAIVYNFRKKIMVADYPYWDEGMPHRYDNCPGLMRAKQHCEQLNEEYRKSKGLNPASLCANCKHLVTEDNNDMTCTRRNQINRLGRTVYIVKGYTTCINFERKEKA